MSQDSVPPAILGPVEAQAALNDPSTPPQVLALIAQQHPALRAQVAQHPQVYPELLDWLARLDQPGDASAAPEPEPVQRSRRWPLILGFGIPIVVIAIVTAAVVWWPRPSTLTTVTSSPSSSTHVGDTATPSTGTTQTPAATQTTGTAATTGSAVSFTGPALQDSANAKTWQVRITYAAGYGLIDYRLPGSSKVCLGVLVQNADQTWLELITQGTCDDRGTWTLTQTSTGLRGDYRPQHGDYRVQAELTKSAAPIPVTIAEKVATEGCTNAASRPLTTVAVFGDEVIGVYNSPGFATEGYRGPRSKPSAYISIVGGDDNIDVRFDSASSDRAIGAIDC